MENNSLYLDGFYRLSEVLIDHGYRTFDHGDTFKRKDECPFRAWVVLPLTLPFHTLLIVIETVACQALRALCSFTIGIFTLHPKMFKAGAIDVLSIPVQLVALPLLGFLAIFSTRTALRVMFVVCKQTSRATVHEVDFSVFAYPDMFKESNTTNFFENWHGDKPVVVLTQAKTYDYPRDSWKVSARVSSVIRSFFAVPTGLIRGVTSFGTALLSFKTKKISCAAIEAFSSLFVPLSSIFVFCDCSKTLLKAGHLWPAYLQRVHLFISTEP